MDFTEIFNGESLTLEQFNERTAEMKLADLATGDYVAKGKYDSDLKKARDDLKTAKDTIATLEANKGDIDTLQAELEKYRQADEARQKAEQEAAAQKALEDRFDAVVNGKEFANSLVRNGTLAEFSRALNDPANTGKGDKELFDALTKDAAGIWKNPQKETVKVPGVTGSWADADNKERMMRQAMGLPIVKGD